MPWAVKEEGQGVKTEEATRQNLSVMFLLVLKMSGNIQKQKGKEAKGGKTFKMKQNTTCKDIRKPPV